MALLRLFRANNLLIIILTQSIVKYYISAHHTVHTGIFATGLSLYYFSLLVICTLIIAAAGYVINDYYDYDLDIRAAKTKSDFSKRKLMWIYLGLVLSGAALSMFLAIRLDLIDLYWFYPTATILLYLYSSHLKSTGLPANILVSAFTAAVVGIVMISEYRSGLLIHSTTLEVLYAFMLFAFLINLYREVIKDMEDHEADQAFGLQTLPIQIGLEKAKLVAAFLGMIGLALVISFAIFHQFHSMFSQVHLILLILIPLSFIIFNTFRSSQPKDYSFVSIALKVLMLAGITFLLYP